MSHIYFCVWDIETQSIVKWGLTYEQAGAWIKEELRKTIM